MYIPLQPAKENEASCPRCHSPLMLVNVHGHAQCQICKSNILECCSGEQCQPIVSDSVQQQSVEET